MKIRDAVPDDAFAAGEVMRRSITELCTSDRGNDPIILRRWLSNKAPEIFRSWIRPREFGSGSRRYRNRQYPWVGCVTDDGEITLNYVSPDARLRGVSTAMLAKLEKRAIERDNGTCRLESTETARRLYRARGYSEDGPAGLKFGTSSGYPMSRRIK